jgi:hypothetical protein
VAKLQDGSFMERGTLGMQQGLRRQNLEFGKSPKVVSVESINSLDAIDFHGGDNLQVEYVPAGHRVTTQQAK